MPRYDDRYGNTRLYVGHVSSRTRTRDLERLFNRYGSNTGLAFSSLAAGGGGKPDAALVMDWSVEKHYVLENGLAKLKDEPKISKYVKIAAALLEKTVRDVAMRCSWMTASALIKSISSAPTLTKLTQSASRNSF
ncbi:hypothetical protein Bca101_036201 [Brassica carinata]